MTTGAALSKPSSAPSHGCVRTHRIHQKLRSALASRRSDHSWLSVFTSNNSLLSTLLSKPISSPAPAFPQPSQRSPVAHPQSEYISCKCSLYQALRRHLGCKSAAVGPTNKSKPSADSGPVGSGPQSSFTCRGDSNTGRPSSLSSLGGLFLMQVRFVFSVS